LLIYLNGDWLDPEDAKVSVLDRAFLFGDGVYETLRTYDRNIVAIWDHLDRLRNSANGLGIDVPDSSHLVKMIEKGVDEIGDDDVYIRIIVTRGNPPFTMKVERNVPNIVMLFERVSELRGKINYEEGVKVSLSRIRKVPPESFDPRIKSIGQPDRIMARLEMEPDDYEAIMLTVKGLVAEGTMSTIFMVKNGILITPSLETGILDGITRKYVIKLAREKGIKVEERFVEVKELFECDEIFLTHTSGGIVPVGIFENGRKMVGEVTKSILKDFKDFVISEGR